MLIAALNATGVLLILTAEGAWRRRLRCLAAMSFGLVLFAMLSAPHWLVFLDQWDSSSPWHDRRVRLAANYAVDRQAVNQAETLGVTV